jgi:threonine dehydratase
MAHLFLHLTFFVPAVMETGPAVSLADVQEAARRIGPFAHRTPVLTCSYLNELSGKQLYFKCENFQKVGAFKFRYNFFLPTHQEEEQSMQ